MTTQLTIDIVSDIACPWCAIGYARLQQAMTELRDEMSFSVTWHAFELNPDQQKGQGLPITEALSRKYGRSPAQIEALQNDMMRIAADLGLNFTRMQERHTCNTFDGHRLVKWATEQDKGTEMKMALFEAYFGRAEDVSDPQVLLTCVADAGLSTEDAHAMLESDRYSDMVRADEHRYQQGGINSVPAFIINGQYMISGAQEPDTLVRALQQVASRA